MVVISGTAGIGKGRAGPALTWPAPASRRSYQIATRFVLMPAAQPHSKPSRAAAIPVSRYEIRPASDELSPVSSRRACVRHRPSRRPAGAHGPAPHQTRCSRPAGSSGCRKGANLGLPVYRVKRLFLAGLAPRHQRGQGAVTHLTGARVSGWCMAKPLLSRAPAACRRAGRRSVVASRG